ncbi:MAG: GNAT family N-acetyltransferase [Pseudomonadota bacterium]
MNRDDIIIPDITIKDNFLDLKPVGPDDFSKVRHVCETSIKLVSGGVLTDEDTAEWCRYVRDPAFTDKLFSQKIVGAWHGSELLAIVAWYPAHDLANTARVDVLAVRPLFENLGLGAALLAEVERQASSAGYETLGVRTLQSATGFFQNRGYRISTYGVFNVTSALSLPVTFVRKNLKSGQTVKSNRLVASI